MHVIFILQYQWFITGLQRLWQRFYKHLFKPTFEFFNRLGRFRVVIFHRTGDVAHTGNFAAFMEYSHGSYPVGLNIFTVDFPGYYAKHMGNYRRFIYVGR